MRRITKTSIALALAVTFTAGCSEDFKREFKEAYDKSFRDSFRESFISSCTDSRGEEEIQTMCACVADDLLQSLKVDQLNDLDLVKKHIDEISLPKCQKPTNPGT